MTTDNFTEAARAEAEKRHQGDWDPFEQEPVDDWGFAEAERRAFVTGAEWARTRLAAQEPTDALVDEIAEQLDFEDDPSPSADPDITWGLPGNERAEAYRDIVRRVLTARATRRDEETR